MTNISTSQIEYKIDGDFVLFNQGNMPRQLFVLFHQLDEYVTLLKDNHYHYMVVMSESEFISCLDMAREL